MLSGVGVGVALDPHPHPIRSHPATRDEVFRLPFSTRLESHQRAMPRIEEAYVFSSQKTDVASNLVTNNEIELPPKKQSQQTRAHAHLHSSPATMKKFSPVSTRSHVRVDSLTGTVSRRGFADRSSSLGPTSIPIQESPAPNSRVTGQCEPKKLQRSDYDIEERVKLAHGGETPWIIQREWNYRVPGRAET